MQDLQRELKSLLDLTHKDQPRENLIALYKSLIKEEFDEFMAESSRTYKEFKELGDMIWLCFQYANLCDYDLEAGMRALVKEYESKFYTKEGKFEPLYREDGKLLKNTGFKKADFTKLYNERQQ